MKNVTKKIAINIGAGYTPGVNSIIMGAALAAQKLGWEVVGIQDGFEGLLFPDRYSDGGLINLGPEVIERLNPAGSDALGTSASIDPFHVRTVNEFGMIEEMRHIVKIFLICLILISLVHLAFTFAFSITFGILAKSKSHNFI